MKTDDDGWETIEAQRSTRTPRGVALRMTAAGLVVLIAPDVAIAAKLAKGDQVLVAANKAGDVRLRLSRYDGMGGYSICGASNGRGSLRVRLGLRALPEWMLMLDYPWTDLAAVVSKGEIVCTLPRRRESPAKSDALVASKARKRS